MPDRELPLLTRHQLNALLEAFGLVTWAADLGVVIDPLPVRGGGAAASPPPEADALVMTGLRVSAMVVRDAPDIHRRSRRALEAQASTGGADAILQAAAFAIVRCRASLLGLLPFLASEKRADGLGALAITRQTLRAAVLLAWAARWSIEIPETWGLLLEDGPDPDVDPDTAPWLASVESRLGEAEDGART